MNTPVTLFRRGFANSSNMMHVRTSLNPDKRGIFDVTVYNAQGTTYVLPNNGGVSTGSTPPADNPVTVGVNTFWYWRCPAGSAIPDGLNLLNDHGDHYLWRASWVMPLKEYRELLGAANFVRMPATMEGRSMDSEGTASPSEGGASQVDFLSTPPGNWSVKDRAFVISAFSNMVATLCADQEDSAADQEHTAVIAHDISLYEAMLAELRSVPVPSSSDQHGDL